jgi:acetyl esterase/lipase
MHIPEPAVPWLVKLARRQRSYSSPERARQKIAAAALRPARFAPPASLGRGLTITRRPGSGWPVYTLVPPGRPASAEPLPVIVYLHGGGWVSEIVVFHWRLAAQLARAVPAEIVVPIYPLIPFGTARSVLDGVLAIVADIRSRTGRVAIAGDSAGGQIALSTALALRDEGIRLDHTALISPALDLSWSNPEIPERQPTDPWLAVPGARIFSDTWRDDLPVSDPAVSPLAGEMTGLGPVSLFTGTHDILNPDARRLLDKLRASEVDVSFHEAPGRLHVYPLLPTWSGQRARTQLVTLLRTAFSAA